MPPINTQGSRAGLITALVIFTILFVTSAIFAIYFNVQLTHQTEAFTNYKKQYTDIVSENALVGNDVSTLKALRSDGNSGYTPNDTVFDIVLKQRNDLIQLITGTVGSDPAAAQKAAGTVLAAAAKSAASASVKLPSAKDNLTGDITALADGLSASAAKSKALADQVLQTNRDLATAKSDVAATSAAGAKALEDARASAAADLQKVNDQFTANKGTIDQLTKDQADADAKATAAAQATQGQLADLQHQVTKVTSDLNATRGKLSLRRPDVTNAAVRQPDGKIVRLPGGNVCYINLGQGDQVTPGLTFEVYDASQGVPPIPDIVTGDEQLPIGKASIEITKVGPTSSECRIIKTTPGAILSEGDLIENLVYDSHTKYNFYVYGNFDLGDTGHANPDDTKVIERLVTQWGGKITSAANVDTDFVVLGKEPVLPNFSKEELDAPLNADKLAKAQAELDKYQEVRQTARELHIPILNQNRFLYYVGYYDQATR